MSARPRNAACPPWCDSNEDQHWTRVVRETDEALHSRRFGQLVTVYIGQEVYATGRTWWASPSIVVKSHRVEGVWGEDGGESLLTPAEAVALAAELAAAYTFTTGLPSGEAPA